MLSDKDFYGMAIEKGELVGIINKFCKEKLAVWLVIKEDELSITVEVRNLNKLDRNALAAKIFDYCDDRISADKPYAASQHVARDSIFQSLLINVKWSRKDSIDKDGEP